MLAKITMFLTVAILAGCSVIPDSIQLEDDSNLIEYQQFTGNPDANVGKVVRWGGVVAKVTNLPDATVVEIVDFPLRSYGRPAVSNESDGRFRVYIDGFVDPVVFDKGRSVTFTGELTGTEDGLVGEHKFLFPTIKSTGYHLWKEIDQVDINSLNMWPYYNTGYWGVPYRPYRQRVTIRRYSDSPSGGAITPTRTSQSTGRQNSSSSSRSNSVKPLKKEP